MSKIKNETVEKIIREHLEANGFDGLFNHDGGCACSLAELFICDQVGTECTPGYFQPLEPGSEHDYCIAPLKHKKLKEEQKTKNTNCICVYWCRTDGWLTKHHPNCKHYNDSLMDVWIVDTGDGICCVDNITELGEFEEIVSIKKSKIHKEVFDYMPEFQGCGNKQYMDKNELQRYLLAKLNKSGIKS